MSDLFDEKTPMDAARTVSVYQHYYADNGPSLPSGNPSSMRFIDRLTDCLDEVDGLILDSYGVIGLGAAPIEGIQDFFKEVKRRALPLVVLTNGASQPAENRLPTYHSWDLPLAVEDIISSRDACYHYLREKLAQNPDERICYLGRSVSKFDDIEGVKYPESGWQEASLFVFMGAVDWHEDDQMALETVLGKQNQAGKMAEIIVANPDVSAPQIDGFSYEPGYWAMRAHHHTNCALTMTGKPFGDAYGLAFAALEAKAGRPLSPQRVAMVGDSLHTDILGANQAGFISVLLRGYGLMSSFDIHHITQQSQIYPALIAEVI